MTANPKRHWHRPRYSLATLFALVTVVGCWLGYQLRWVKQRQQLLADKRVTHIVDPWSNVDPPSAPGFLGLLGEKGVYYIGINAEGHDFDHLTESDLHRLDQGLSLFPESRVAVWAVSANGRNHRVRWDR